MLRVTRVFVLSLFLIAVFVLFLSVISQEQANAHLYTQPKNNTLNAIFESQTKNLKHAKYVCRHGKNYSKRWHCKTKIWLHREWKESYRKLYPVLNIKSYTIKYHPCLAQIIAGENKTYDPTLDFGGGHGNVYEPYGIPQANPGTKMASAGPDWRTNPFTQLKWMIGYTVGRYGSECRAMAFKLANGWY